MPKRTREQAEQTRLRLIAAGSKLFAKRGFDAVSAEDLVAESGVTRGALYHHFADGKRGVFLAVLTDAMVEAKRGLATATKAARDPVDALERGIKAFLALSAKPGYQRILLVDGPAVLGWHAWRALDLQHGLGLLRVGLRAVAKTRITPAFEVETASHLLGGAMTDSAMLIATSKGDRQMRKRVEATLLRLLQGLIHE